MSEYANAADCKFDSLVHLLETRAADQPQQLAYTFFAPALSALTWGVTEELSEQLAGSWRAPHVNHSTIAFLQYTSGSTATPKGVMVTHGGLLHNEELIRHAFHEVVCFIDFGVDTASVLTSLQHLSRLRELSEQSSEPKHLLASV